MALASSDDDAIEVPCERPGPRRGSTELHKVLSSNPHIGEQIVRRLAAGYTLLNVQAFALRFGYEFTEAQLHYFRTEYIPDAQKFMLPRLHKGWGDWQAEIDVLNSLQEMAALQWMRIVELRQQEIELEVAIPEMTHQISLFLDLVSKIDEIKTRLGLIPSASLNVNVSGAVNQRHSGVVGHEIGAITGVLGVCDVEATPEELAMFAQAVELGYVGLSEVVDEREQAAADDEAAEPEE